MRSIEKKALQREILLGFWKVSILEHAKEEPVVGQWMIRELRQHGYEISPGTIYPLLARLEQLGWLLCRSDLARRRKGRKEYSLTSAGRVVLAKLKDRVEELYFEVVLGKRREKGNGEYAD
jgi:PadR family transcriptional regulator, regulatory protein PadR